MTLQDEILLFYAFCMLVGGGFIFAVGWWAMHLEKPPRRKPRECWVMFLDYDCVRASLKPIDGAVLMREVIE